MATYDYDYFVIGGGSGGLASAKTAADLGAKVAVADFVMPSPQGSTWGVGGTCVNVGCIPKKLMHGASLFREAMGDASGHGWDVRATHSWSAMVGSIDQHIKTTNVGAKTEMREKNIKYYNSFATFEDAHTLSLQDGAGKTERVSAKYILIACGGRPSYGDYPGCLECCHSSDDLFSMAKPPGKTLVVGASYIALECAGFLAGFGFDTTVMVRSILLRGFDQDIAAMIGDYMEKHGVKFAREMIPSKFERTADKRVRVFVKDAEFGVFDTVLMAVGRTGCVKQLLVERAGVGPATDNGKLNCNEREGTNVENIFCVGDAVFGKPELTPVASLAGKLLARRLFGGADQLMDYADIATTVFTPVEFGTVGLSEEVAAKVMGGKDKIKVYHAAAMPLEWSLPDERTRLGDKGYIKIVVDPAKGEKVLGIHLIGPNAGEVVQGFAAALKVGITKSQLDDVVGIHPTFAEDVTTVKEVKVEGGGVPTKGSC